MIYIKFNDIIEMSMYADIHIIHVLFVIKLAVVLLLFNYAKYCIDIYTTILQQL